MVTDERLREWFSLLLVTLGVLGLLVAVIGFRLVTEPQPPDRFDVVRTVSTEAERECGTRCVPLESGQAIEFTFDVATRPTFTMTGVGYPLWLFDGVRWQLMRPESCCYRTAPNVDFLEVRP